MTTITAAAPQLLVEKLEDSLAFYQRRLGFSCDFVYEGFYAGISRDHAIIHLKCAPKLGPELTYRRLAEHLDAFLVVSGLDELHAEFVGRGATITKPPEQMPWGTRDFYVEDPDGNILCFSEVTKHADEAVPPLVFPPV